MNDYKFGNFIYTLRVEKGLTQSEVAKRLGVSAAAVSKWENGSTKPRYELLLKLAEILEVSSEELVSGERAEMRDEPIAEVAEEVFEKRRPSVLKIVLITLCALAIALCVYFLIAPPKQKPKTYGNVNSNCQEYCAIIKHGDWIYYCNINRDNDVYKIRADGTEKQKVIEGTVMSIGVTDDWIYYCEGNLSGADAGIYKVRHDGTEKEKLVPGAYWYIYVTEDWIYYADQTPEKGGNIYRMKPDGTRQTVLSSQNCGNISIYDGWIYYVNKNSEFIYKMRLDGSQLGKFRPLHRATSAVVEDGVLYTYNGTFFKKVNLDGTDSKRYFEEGVERFIVSDGCVYYVKSNPKRSIFNKLNPDMTERSRVLLVKKHFPSLYMCVIDDCLYFPNGEDAYRMYRIKIDGSGEIERVN